MTNTAASTLHPLVEWAQREKLLYLTVEVDNVSDLEVTDKSLHVKGTYGGSKTVYEVTLEFYAEIKTDYRKIDNNRHLELVITKEAASWWPRLLKNTVKLPWVKVDFNKWKEEDDEEEDFSGGDFDFQNYMSKLGDGGAGGAPNLDDFDDDDDKDEDDEDMPDLEDVDNAVSAESGKNDAGAKDDENKEKKVEEAGDKKEEVVQLS